MNPTPNPQNYKKLPHRGHKSPSKWEIIANKNRQVRTMAA
jgi:hypothetical protein